MMVSCSHWGMFEIMMPAWWGDYYDAVVETKLSQIKSVDVLAGNALFQRLKASG